MWLKERKTNKKNADGNKDPRSLPIYLPVVPDGQIPTLQSESDCHQVGSIDDQISALHRSLSISRAFFEAAVSCV